MNIAEILLNEHYLINCVLYPRIKNDIILSHFNSFKEINID